MTAPRYALYFTPDPDDALGRLGEALLCAEPAGLPGINPAALKAHTADPRVYGFHATLKAPFRLAEGRGEGDLLAALKRFGEARPPAEPVRLRLAPLGRFLALVPAEPARDLDLLAAEVVAAFEPFRAPLTPEDRARRLKAPLTPRETALLDSWGYPYVFEAFRFHMTLAGPLPEEARDAWLGALEPLCRDLPPVSVDALTLLVQPAPGAPFGVVERAPFRGSR